MAEKWNAWRILVDRNLLAANGEKTKFEVKKPAGRRLVFKRAMQKPSTDDQQDYVPQPNRARWPDAIFSSIDSQGHQRVIKQQHRQEGGKEACQEVIAAALNCQRNAEHNEAEAAETIGPAAMRFGLQPIDLIEGPFLFVRPIGPPLIVDRRSLPGYQAGSSLGLQDLRDLLVVVLELLLP